MRKFKHYLWAPPVKVKFNEWPKFKVGDIVCGPGKLMVDKEIMDDEYGPVMFKIQEAAYHQIWGWYYYCQLSDGKNFRAEENKLIKI